MLHELKPRPAHNTGCQRPLPSSLVRAPAKQEETDVLFLPPQHNMSVGRFRIRKPDRQLLFSRTKKDPTNRCCTNPFQKFVSLAGKFLLKSMHALHMRARKKEVGPTSTYLRHRCHKQPSGYIYFHTSCAQASAVGTLHSRPPTYYVGLPLVYDRAMLPMVQKHATHRFEGADPSKGAHI